MPKFPETSESAHHLAYSETMSVPHIHDSSANAFAKRTPLIFYTAMLAVGLLADLAHCWFQALPNIWLQFLPGLYYAGILFAAITFGTAGGLGAATLAGICHTATGFVCRQQTLEPGVLLVFVLIALTAGWLTHPKKAVERSDHREADAEATTVFHNREESALVQLLALEPTRPGLIHQLRTPVASIEGAAFLLDDPDLADEKRDEFVGIVRRECQRLEALLELLESRQPQL